MALGGLGAAAIVGPLVAALPRAPSPAAPAGHHGALLGIDTQERAAVTRALSDAVKREKASHVQAAGCAALKRLIFSDIAPTA